jgi:hypothetical protein
MGSRRKGEKIARKKMRGKDRWDPPRRASKSSFSSIFGFVRHTMFSNVRHPNSQPLNDLVGKTGRITKKRQKTRKGKKKGISATHALLLPR